jgi:ferredoxin
VKRLKLRIDPIACDGHGLCAELFPERIVLDEWGYPMIAEEAIGPELRKHAQRAVAACPTLALRLEQATASRAEAEPRMAR